MYLNQDINFKFGSKLFIYSDLIIFIDRKIFPIIKEQLPASETMMMNHSLDDKICQCCQIF
ncbi:hypothetical protein BpHYR1_044659 [Brachionus plicatilis]|uniref:Uncharacterized protein n=1 Tax=Brachionus plicatilis TaxID=10195 RepID=A0A3M7Q8H3_BRAPC|nr:hypothetical protein BpHYR1_044659 [Brachionus plicatilis]